MADPVTIGTLAAAALSIAVEAALKGTVGEAVKDAYKALKDKIVQLAGSDAEALEKTPASAGRQTVMAEAVDARPPDEQAIVRELAERLIAELRHGGPGNVGIDVGRLEALEVQLGAIAVIEGTGARIGEALIRGKLKTGDITVGEPPPKR